MSDAVVQDSDDLDILEDLGKRSLVLQNGNWSMHGLLRNFFYERQSPKSRESMHENAAEYYNASLRVASDRIEETYHLIKARDLETAVWLMTIEGKKWLKQGFQDEILNLCRLISTDKVSDAEDYEIKMLQGLALTQTGDWKTSYKLFTSCLELSDKLSDQGRKARALRRIGAILYRKGEFSEALAILTEGLGYVKEDDRLKSEIENSIGVIYWKLGKLDKAQNAFQQDLKISRNQNDQEGITRALNNLGILHSQGGSYDEALQLYAEAIKIAGKNNDNKLVSTLYSNIADAYKHKGENKEAQRFYERCIELSEELGFTWQIAEAYRGMADVLPEVRDKYLKKALEVFESLGAKEDIKIVKNMMK